MWLQFFHIVKHKVEMIQNELLKPCLTFGVGILFHLPIAEVVSVQPNAHPQKVKVTKGYINGLKAVKQL